MSIPSPQPSSPRPRRWFLLTTGALVSLVLLVGFGVTWPTGTTQQAQPQQGPTEVVPAPMEKAVPSTPVQRQAVEALEVFDNMAAVLAWAEKTSFGGTWHTELNHRKYHLLVVYRSHTSGVQTVEPFVFVELAGRWVRLLHAATCRFQIDASVEGDWLVLRHGQDVYDKQAGVELLRYSLVDLESRFWLPVR